MRLSPAAAAALALCAACNTGFDPQYRVTDVRILGTRVRVQGSTAADGSPGQTLEIEVLVANPVQRAGLTVTWYGCMPASTEALVPCADPSFLANPDQLAAGDPSVLPLGTCEPSPQDGICAITVPLPAPDLADPLAFVVNLALQEPVYQCRLYAEMPVVAVAEAEGVRSVALKRVRITPDPSTLTGTVLEGAYVVNENPTFSEVVRAPTDTGPGCGGGTSIATEPFPQGDTVLCALAALPGSVQQFNACGPDGERTLTSEELSWQWFTTGGDFPDFDSGIGNVTERAVHFARPAGAFRLWAILRDGRGGEDWLEQDVAAAP